MSQAGIVDLESSNPQIPTQFDADIGFAIPIANVLEILGDTSLAGVTPVYTDGSGNTITTFVQTSQAIAATDATKIGLSAFDSADFTVDANGFVTLASGAATGSFNVDAATAPGTDPVVPTVGGLITVTGGQVASGTVGANVIRTDSLAANTYTIEIQRSTAIGASSLISNGVSHFNSSHFSVDGNGFVTITAGGLGVVSVSGTAARITSTGGANPVIDISASYVGQSSITTLGTITTGVWNGTKVSEVYGGTNQSTYVIGDILYASAANTLSKLAAGSNTQVLTLAAGIPSWATPTTGTVTSVSGTLNRITSTGGATPVIDISASYVGQTSITTLGTVATGTWNASVIGLNYGGTNANLTASNGGIFYSTATAGAILAGTATAGLMLRSGAVGAPTWSTATFPSTATSTGTILRADGTNWVATTSTYPNTNNINTLLYASSANIMSELATSNNGVLITGTTGIPAWLAAGTTGQVLTATTSAAPIWSTPISNSSIRYSNLGVAYNGGTGVFKVTSESGSALSATNYATIVLPSIATPGTFKTYTVTADQSFIDDVGASNIIGNLFGFTTGVAITVDVPFYIYAVAKTDETAIAFMLGRTPHKPISPAAANIGFPGTPGTNAQTSLFSIPTITAANYAVSPCVCVGAIRMIMSAANDWTVQTLATTTKTDGIGSFYEENVFTIPLGQFGANAGTLTVNNGGTSAVFSATTGTYYIKKNGIVSCYYAITSDGGTDGAGAVQARFAVPYTAQSPSISTSISIVGGATQSNYNTYINTGENNFNLQNANTTPVLWSAFTNANRSVFSSQIYQITV